MSPSLRWNAQTPPTNQGGVGRQQQHDHDHNDNDHDRDDNDHDHDDNDHDHDDNDHDHDDNDHDHDDNDHYHTAKLSYQNENHTCTKELNAVWDSGNRLLWSSLARWRQSVLSFIYQF